MATKEFDPKTVTKRYKSRLASMKNERAKIDPILRDIRDFFGPRTARFEGEEVAGGRTRQDQKIFNSGPRYALRTLAGGMQSGITPPMRPWFKLGSPDPEMNEFEPVKYWLADVERIIRDILARSNFYNTVKKGYGSQGLYGTMAMSLEEDSEDIIRAHEFPMGSYYIANSAAGRVNGFAREFMMTTYQMIEKFGLKNVPDHVREAYDKGDYDTWHPVCQFVEPNQYARNGSLLSRDKPYMSLYLNPSSNEENAVLGMSGFDYFPILAPRWDVLGEDVYGIGCGEVALGDGKQLQVMEKRKLQGVDQNVRPTMVADASMRPARTTFQAGETIYSNGLIATGNPGYRRAYEINPMLNEMREEIAVISQRIDEGFYKNLFLMVSEIADQPNITATQINTMREEKLLMLGPVLERENDELLDPVIDIVFDFAQRRGILPPAPPELQGMPLKVEYIGILAQAQKAMGVGNIERFVGFVGQVAQIWPQARNKLNPMQLVDEYAEGVGVSPRIVNSDEAAMSEMEAEQQQQQAAMAASSAEPVSAALKNLSQANLAGDNALSRMVGA